ncbi:hypothetical protein GQ457_HM001120 [Hibiscus cannabinus]
MSMNPRRSPSRARFLFLSCFHSCGGNAGLVIFPKSLLLHCSTPRFSPPCSSFRGVCISWRASFPLPPKFPTLPKQLRFHGNYPTRKHIPSFVISRMNVYGICRPGFEASSNQNCWFIKVEKTKQSNKSRVLSPFYQHPIKSKPPSFPKELPHLSQIPKTLTVSSTHKLRRFSSLGKEGGMLLIGCRENGLNTSCKWPGSEEHGGENRHVKKYRRRDLLEVETNMIVDDKRPFLLRWRELWKSNHFRSKLDWKRSSCSTIELSDDFELDFSTLIKTLEMVAIV